jgi:inorganic pyrophosphatase
MKLSNIKPGNKPPEDLNVIIEIPANSSPVKYEFDKDFGMLKVDRFHTTSMVYPCNYGFVPNTMSGDGDPIDVLVVADHALIHGCVINVRPVGVLFSEDESGEDEKIIAVPSAKVDISYAELTNIDQIDPFLREKIKHFFTHYKDLESEKWVKVKEWGSAAIAKQSIIASLNRN